MNVYMAYRENGETVGVYDDEDYARKEAGVRGIVQKWLLKHRVLNALNPAMDGYAERMDGVQGAVGNPGLSGYLGDIEFREAVLKTVMDNLWTEPDGSDTNYTGLAQLRRKRAL